MRLPHFRFRLVLTLLSSLLTLELFYFILIYHQAPPPTDNAELVLVYGGRAGRTRTGLELANRLKKPLFLSENYGGMKDLGRQMGPIQVPVLFDPRSRTTDQNARSASDAIRKTGYKRVVLVTSWYHMPRSLFLTRLYLTGSGTEAVPYPSEPLPKNWWKNGDFFLELLKFWGSLGRAGLAAFGIKTGPK